MMSYIQIHKARGLILLAVVVIILCVIVLIHIRPVGSRIYASCAQARAAGHGDIPKNSHFYNPALDKNNNGYACE